MKGEKQKKGKFLRVFENRQKVKGKVIKKYSHLSNSYQQLVSVDST